MDWGGGVGGHCTRGKTATVQASDNDTAHDKEWGVRQSARWRSVGVVKVNTISSTGIELYFINYPYPLWRTLSPLAWPRPLLSCLDFQQPLLSVRIKRAMMIWHRFRLANQLCLGTTSQTATFIPDCDRSQIRAQLEVM